MSITGKNWKLLTGFLQSVLPLDRGILKVSTPRLRLRQALSLGMAPLLGHYHLTQNNQKPLLSFIIESRGLGFKDLQCAMKWVCWSSSSWHCKLMSVERYRNHCIHQAVRSIVFGSSFLSNSGSMMMMMMLMMVLFRFSFRVFVGS